MEIWRCWWRENDRNVVAAVVVVVVVEGNGVKKFCILFMRSRQQPMTSPSQCIPAHAYEIPAQKRGLTGAPYTTDV